MFKSQVKNIKIMFLSYKNINLRFTRSCHFIVYKVVWSVMCAQMVKFAKCHIRTQLWSTVADHINRDPFLSIDVFSSQTEINIKHNFKFKFNLSGNVVNRSLFDFHFVCLSVILFQIVFLIFSLWIKNGFEPPVYISEETIHFKFNLSSEKKWSRDEKEFKPFVFFPLRL